MSDYEPAAVLDFKFSTILDAVPTTLAGTPVVSVYKDNSTTQSTTGVTLTVDFDGITGCHNVRVDTSADGTFYAAGSSFQVVVTAGTVGGKSLVGFVVDNFSLRRTAALKPTLAGRTLDIATTGEAGLDFSNIKQATGATTLNNITVPTVGAVQAFSSLAAGQIDVIYDATIDYVTSGATLAATQPNYAPAKAGDAMALTTGERASTGTAVWATGTRALTDKTGFTLTQAFPTNFSALGINVSGHVSRVTLVDTTTTNTDMRGTNGAITSLSGIATAANVTTSQAAIIAAIPTDYQRQNSAVTLPSPAPDGYGGSFEGDISGMTDEQAAQLETIFAYAAGNRAETSVEGTRTLTMYAADGTTPAIVLAYDPTAKTVTNVTP